MSWFLHSVDSLFARCVCVVSFLISACCIGARVLSRLVALVFTVVIGVLACLSECLHVLVHRVVVQQWFVFPGKSK